MRRATAFTTGNRFEALRRRVVQLEADLEGIEARRDAVDQAIDTTAQANDLAGLADFRLQAAALDEMASSLRERTRALHRFLAEDRR